MTTSLAELPGVARAKLPESYEGARQALDKCQRIDECAEWANKAEALASYAKQAEDDGLRKMADRIQARAIRRCGVLLGEIEDGQGARTDQLGGSAPPKLSRAQAARDAGMSRDQKRTALRVASVPEDEFEAAVESDDPPTVTALAEQGTQPRAIVNLRGRDPKDYAIASQALGMLRRFVEFTEHTDPAAIARGAAKREHRIMTEQITTVRAWLTRLVREIDS